MITLFGFSILQNLILFRISVCSIKISQRFSVGGEINRVKKNQCHRDSLSVWLLPQPHDSNPITHLLDIMSDLFEYTLRNCS